MSCVTNEVGGIPKSSRVTEREFTRERGWTTTVTVEGRETEVMLEATGMAFAGFSPVKVVSLGGDLWQATGQAAGLGGPEPVDPDTLITVKWSVPGNSLEKDLWEKPVVKAQMDLIKAAYPSDPIKGTQAQLILKLCIQAALEGRTTIDLPDLNGVEETYTVSVGEILSFAAASGAADTSVFRDLMESFARGTEKFPVSSWVLRRNMTGPLTSSLRGVRTNVNRMFTTARLIADYDPPTSLLDEIPPGYWLKQTPTVEQDGDRLLVQNEWWWTEDYDRFALGAPLT